MSQSVLIIDDSADIHDLLAFRLGPENLEVHHALHARDGLGRARALQPDLILLDVDMPDLSGFEVCQQLKADPTTACIPVIFLTATSHLHTKVAGFELGAADYVTKPFEPAELRARVRAALRTKRYQDLLSSRAQLDALTSLWNRAYFEQRLHDEVAAVTRYGRRVSLVMMDIDHFKRLNDDFGHPFGDLVLQRVGDLLWRGLRSVDAPCRYGGEEFGVILTETDLAGAVEAAERLRRELGLLRFTARGQVVRVTASFGAACTADLGASTPVTPRMLLQAADDCLYEAKRAGRDQVRGSSAPRLDLAANGAPAV